MELLAELIGDFVEWIIILAAFAAFGFVLMRLLG
jgi:hypothetical protein